MTFVDAKFHAAYEASSAVAALVGVQSTDVLIAFASSSNGTRKVTPPSGWTQIASTTTEQAGQQVFTAPGSANVATTWTWPTQQWSRVVIAAYRGVSAPSAASVASSNSTTVVSLDAPSRTTAAANATLVVFGGSSTGSTLGFTPAMTSRASATGGAGFLLADQTIATAGATGVRTFSSGSTAILTAASVALEVANVADTTAPTVSLTDPTPAGQPAGYDHIAGTVTLQATATDDSGSLNRVEFLVDGVLAHTDSVGTPPTYSYPGWDTTTLADGSHTLVARAYDNAGNSADSPVTVTVNNGGRWAGPGLAADLRLAPPPPTRTWDYQTGDLSQWEEAHGAAPVIVTDHPHRSMLYAAEYTVVYGQNATFDAGVTPAVDRTEMSEYDLAKCGNIAPGTEQWWAFSVQFPANLVAPTSWCAWVDFHHTGSTGSTPFSFRITPNVSPPRMQVYVRGGDESTGVAQTYDLGECPLDGTWVDFRFYVLWSDTAAGRLIIKKNTDPAGKGFAVVQDITQANMFTGFGIYVNEGVYRNTYNDTEVWYHTGLRRGDSESSVSY